MKRLKENPLHQSIHARTIAGSHKKINSSPYADRLRQHAFKKADVRVLSEHLGVSDAQAAQGLIFLAADDFNGKIIESKHLDYKADRHRKSRSTRAAAARAIFEYFHDVLLLLRSSD